MPDNLAVYAAIEDAIKYGKKGAVATVINVIGSSYRKVGSKMYIDENNKYIGLISGGCLEADVAEVAKTVIRQGKPLMQQYDMTEDLVWGLGLGCPGKVQIYIEPING